MLKIQHNISLKNFNTFGIDVNAKHFVAVTSISELIETLQLKEYQNPFVLGGGSNMLLTQDIEALVIHLNIKGIEIIEENDKEALIKASAGENWHQFVLWSLEQNFGGVENMSLIPGNVGTSPIQNIGAYGVELKDVFVSCEALEIASLELKSFHLKDCKFGYRNSIFKNEQKGKYIITSVTFRLSKKDHLKNTSYGAIEAELSKMEIEDPSIQDISRAVIAIRQSKLPDPAVLGNSGSFFKNPVISAIAFKEFQKENPEAPHYIISENQVKVPAGWLIEQVGFKGKRFGDAGIHDKQALVLVNHGKASGKEIWQVAQTIQKTVKEKFGIAIEAEVNVI